VNLAQPAFDTHALNRVQLAVKPEAQIAGFAMQPDAMAPNIRAIPWLVTAPVSARAISPALGLRRPYCIGSQEQHRSESTNLS